MPTITDIAKECRTSKATVYKVVNGNDREISAAKRQHILSVVERLGYRPSALARGLSRQRSNMIGIVTGMGPGLLSASYFTSIIGGVLDETALNGQTMALFNRVVWRDEERHETIFADGRCDGLIVINPASIDGLAPALMRLRLPFVAVNSGEWIPGAFCIDIDNVQVGRKVTEYLISKGHRRIAFMHSAEMKTHSLLRFDGYKKALEAASLPYTEDLEVHDNENKRLRHQHAQQLLKLPESIRPTAIVCADDSIALSLVMGLRDAGVRVPADISIVGINGIPDSERSFPRLTTLSQSLEELGAAATKLLLSIIDNPAAEPRHIVWNTQIVERESVARIESDESNPKR